MLIKFGTKFEVEIGMRSLFIRAGSFERFFNSMGYPSH
jgi:hypothetical protein